MKRTISLLLIVAILISICCSLSINAFAATLYWPVPGHTSLSQGFHDGNAIDISDGSIGGAKIIAALGGTVTHKYTCAVQHYGTLGDCDGFGTGIVIKGTDGRTYQYAHMQANSIPSNVYVGATVKAGQEIGKVGTTGNSTGNHLHFGISYGNFWEAGVNPLNESYNYSTGSNPQASFSDWSDVNYTFISSTNASIGQIITTSGGSFTQFGMLLFNANGTQIGRGTDTPTSGISKYFFNINTELGCTLTPNTTYKYQFFAVVGGKTIYGSTKSFTTSQIVFKDWWNDNYTYIGTTDASIGQDISATGAAYTQNGMILYNSLGEELSHFSQASTPGYTKYFVKCNAEMHYTLTPGTTYKYRFFAVVSGVTYYSELKSFKTNSTSKINMTWEGEFNLPSRTGAYVCVKAKAPSSGTFNGALIKVWDSTGKVVVSKSDEPFSTINSSLSVMYDIYSETGVLLNPESSYTYQITVDYNGNSYLSPVYSFTTENQREKYFGIDVSAYQANIDWSTASKYIDYAIIRCGFGSDYTSNDDQYWEYNVSECERLGIPYGVYLYSYAENDNEAASEAAHVLRLLKGHTPTLPVFYDLEDNNTVGKLSANQIYKQTKIFCEAVEKANYKTGVYANESWWNNKLTGGSFENWSKWIAVYQSSSNALSSSKWNLWQYTSQGKIPGINGSVDLDYSASSIHIHSWNSGVVTKIPTCTSSGVRTYTCSCGETKTEAIAATGHIFVSNQEYCQNGCGTKNPNYATEHIHHYLETVIYPDATRLGYTEHTCSCGEYYFDNYTAPTGKLALKCAARTANAEKLQWNNVKTATGYQVQISNAAGNKWSTYATLKAGVTAYTFKNLAAGNNYKFRVRFYIKAADGKNYFSPWSATLNSPTLPKGTNLALAAAKKAFTSKWVKVAGVTGYQVQYSTNAKFTGAKTVTLKGAAKYAVAVKNLKGGARYYVHIRTYKTIGGKNYFSTWSAVKAVVTKK